MRSGSVSGERADQIKKIIDSVLRKRCDLFPWKANLSHRFPGKSSGSSPYFTTTHIYIYNFFEKIYIVIGIRQIVCLLLPENHEKNIGRSVQRHSFEQRTRKSVTTARTTTSQSSFSSGQGGPPSAYYREIHNARKDQRTECT